MKPFLVFDGLGYTKDFHNFLFQGQWHHRNSKDQFFFFGGASQGPIRYAGRYVASAAVSSRCLKPTERILEVNKETDIRDSIPWTEGCLEMLKFLGMNLQKFI